MVSFASIPRCTERRHPNAPRRPRRPSGALPTPGSPEEPRLALAVALLELLEGRSNLVLDGALHCGVVPAHDEPTQHLGNDHLRTAHLAHRQGGPPTAARFDLDHKLEGDERQAVEPAARGEIGAELADQARPDAPEERVLVLLSAGDPPGHPWMRDLDDTGDHVDDERLGRVRAIINLNIVDYPGPADP